MPGLYEVLPTNTSSNPFRALLNRDSGEALITPPFSGEGVLKEVSGDVGIIVKMHSSSKYGTVVHFNETNDTILDNYEQRVDHTISRLLNALGATVSAELFVEYYGKEE